MSRRVAELTAPEAAERLAAGACAILPMGSLETHGPHAPMGDYLLADALCVLMAERAAGAGADALVLPPIPFGGEDFFDSVPGAVSLSLPLVQALVEETAEALLRNGARRILVVNGHGGSIPAVEAAARALRRRRGAVVPALHLWRAAAVFHAGLGGGAGSLGHGGDPVWSVALHLRPDLCRPERAAKPREGAAAPAPSAFGLPVSGFGQVRCAGADFAVPTDVEEAAPGGVSAADPRGGSAAHGARLVEELVAAGAAMVVHLQEYVA
ncbi:MAG: creatininase family protein [Acetobacteraceae bacterium]|nr:creatininase family protein [Acetobacteraceae bacterium]